MEAVDKKIQILQKNIQMVEKNIVEKIVKNCRKDNRDSEIEIEGRYIEIVEKMEIMKKKQRQ